MATWLATNRHAENKNNTVTVCNSDILGIISFSFSLLILDEIRVAYIVVLLLENKKTSIISCRRRSVLHSVLATVYSMEELDYPFVVIFRFLFSDV